MNDIDHLLICPLGGYTHLRHNSLRDTFAELLSVFCKDVSTEPSLLPTTEELETGTVTGDAAKLDVAARGIWVPFEKTLLDIRVTHPNAPYQRNKSMTAIYNDHEGQKKRKYLDRVLNVERATFVPVVLSTSGGYAPEADRLLKRIGEMTAKKRQEKYADVMKHLRNKIRFTLLRATLVSIRGFRGSKHTTKDISAEADIDFNLIPTARTADAW